MSKLSGEKAGISAEERARNAAKYARDMAPHVAADLEAARSDIVRRYRAHPQSWPDGIDTQYDRWYDPEEWTDAGERVQRLDH